MQKGEGLQSFIKDVLPRVNRGLIKRVDPPVKVIRWERGTNRFHGCFADKGALDFSGSFRGRHVEFDAKDSALKNIPKKRNFKGHQLVRLDDLAVDGSIAGIWGRFRAVNDLNREMWFIPARPLLDVFMTMQSITFKACCALECDGMAYPISYHRPEKDFTHALECELKKLLT